MRDCGGAVVEFTSSMLLVYCIGVVPFQLSFWSNLSACERVPTIDFDMFVDLFFAVMRRLPTTSLPYLHQPSILLFYFRVLGCGPWGCVSGTLFCTKNFPAESLFAMIGTHRRCCVSVASSAARS